MFQGKSVITALLAVATTILLSAGQAQAQGCGSRQSATVRGTGQQSTLLSALRQQQQNALLTALQQQQLTALQQQQLPALQQQQLNALLVALQQQQQQNALLVAALQQLQQQQAQQPQLRAAGNGK